MISWLDWLTETVSVYLWLLQQSSTYICEHKVQLNIWLSLINQSNYDYPPIISINPALRCQNILFPLTFLSIGIFSSVFLLSTFQSSSRTLLSQIATLHNWTRTIESRRPLHSPPRLIFTLSFLGIIVLLCWAKKLVGTAKSGPR